MQIENVFENVVKELEQIKEEYNKLEYNLFNVQLQFNFEENDDREEERLVSLGRLDWKE